MKRRNLGRLPVGDAGVDKTIEEMSRMARSDASSTELQRVIAQFRGDDWGFLQDAFRYVVKTVPYISDPEGQEFVVAPRHLIAKRWVGGDCDDMSTLLAALLLAAGRKCWFKTIEWKPDVSGFTHVYLLGEVPSLQLAIPLDAVKGATGFGWEKRPYRRAKVYPV